MGEIEQSEPIWSDHNQHQIFRIRIFNPYGCKQMIDYLIESGFSSVKSGSALCHINVESSKTIGHRLVPVKLFLSKNVSTPIYLPLNPLNQTSLYEIGIYYQFVSYVYSYFWNVAA